MKNDLVAVAEPVTAPPRWLVLLLATATGLNALACHMGGWGAVCVTGAVLPAASLAWWATERRPV